MINFNRSQSQVQVTHNLDVQPKNTLDSILVGITKDLVNAIDQN